jgi:hypothetical protein
VLRLEHVRSGELAERHLGVHLDHPLVDLRQRVHLEDLLAQRERLLGKALAGDRPRDLVRLRERAGLESRTRWSREDTARAAAAHEGPRRRIRCACAEPGRVDRDVDRDHPRAKRQHLRERDMRRDLDVAARIERDRNPALPVAVDARHEDACLDSWSLLRRLRRARIETRCSDGVAKAEQDEPRERDVHRLGAVERHLGHGLSVCVPEHDSPGLRPVGRVVELERQIEPRIVERPPDRLVEVVAHGGTLEH